MKIIIRNSKMGKIRKFDIPTEVLAGGDWFRCKQCGHEARLLVLGNFTTCPECGGLMERI